MTPELQNKVIKKVDLKAQPWSTQHGWYGHIVYFTDGTKGELYHCKEGNPDWLREGESLSFIVDRQKYPNKFPDKPFIVLMETIEQESQYSRSRDSSPQTNSPRSNRGGKSWSGNKSYSRLEDDPEIWMKKQKFISTLKIFEIIMPLVVKGEIKYENVHKEVTKHLKFVMESSGVNELVISPVGAMDKTSANENMNTSVPAQAPVKSSGPLATQHRPTTKSPVRQVNPQRNETHSINQDTEERDVNPSLYIEEEQATLFEEDSNLVDTDIPPDLLQKIVKCDTKAKLIGLQRSLPESQLNNKKVIEAFLNQKKSFERKSKS